MTEVITCQFGWLKDRHGNHLHDDSCFAVRELVSSGCAVTDGRHGYWSCHVPSLKPAPPVLLARKQRAAHAAAALITDWDGSEPTAHDTLERLLDLVHRYEACDASELNKPNAPLHNDDPKIRRAFDAAAALVLRHYHVKDFNVLASTVLKGIVELYGVGKEAKGG